MINITILDKPYQLPSAREITIHRFVEFLEFTDAHAPESLKDPEFEGERDTLAEAKYFALELHFWTGCPLIDLNRHGIEEIYGVWVLQQEQLYATEDNTYHGFTLDGEFYALPKRYMTDSTIEDFAEASEFEKQFADMQNGVYLALPKIAAVLCRKQGERFYDYDFEQRAQLFDSELTAWDAFQIGFFLLRQSKKLATDLKIYSASLTIVQLKQVLKNSLPRLDGSQPS